jgi:signal transduction histidine kinase
MNTLLFTTEIRTELDVVLVRQRARQIAGILELDAQEQTRISTAVSEVARNAFLYALGGRVQFSIEGAAPENFVIRISDRGPGIANLREILSGLYKSPTGLGKGLAGAKRLMDTFHVDTTSRGTTIELGKSLPLNAPKVGPQIVARIVDAFTRLAPASLMEESRQQNADLLRAFDELRSRQLELDRMYREVADANRQMTSANTQLEEKAMALETTARAERQARAEAEQAVASREEILAVVSHDLRNPLAVIVSGAAVLQRMSLDKDSERVHKYAQTILRSASRMERLIADLLDLAQIRAGKLAVELKPQCVEPMVHEGMETLRATATRMNLTLDCAVTAGLHVRCDRERVLQVLSNLIGNAVKFTPHGGAIRVDAREGRQEAVFSVSDTGPGIPPEELPRIFDRFWQAKKNDRGGIGLGLSIVQGLVEAHGGRLWAESKPGAGASFFFTLPLAEPEAAVRVAS